VANEVIKKNVGQIPKNLWTDNIEGELIHLVRTMTDNDEGKFVADTIQEQKLRNHYNNSDFAILYRTNAQSRSFEESLRRMGIPCRIYGGVSFYQRKEIKDLLAYLRVTVNPLDEESLKRIVNYPIRGIGKTTIEKMVILANEYKLPVFEIMARAGEFGFKAGTLQSMSGFVTMIRYFQSILTNKNAYDVSVQVGKHTELVKELFNDKSAEGLDRYNNVQELLNSIKEWTESPSNDDGELGDKSLGAYLQQVTLHTDADDDKENTDVVRLMTIHAAKGLEFAGVFVGGIEETLFPSAMSINTREELEEERRLFYVAVTRAKQRLWLSYANTRYRYGQLVQNDPSRFLDEIPEKYLDKSYAGSANRNNGSWNGNSAGRSRGSAWGDYNDMAAPVRSNKITPGSSRPATPEYLPPAPPKVVEHVPSTDFAPSDTSGLQVGQQVEHQKFGFGKVTRMEGSAHNPVATIVFTNNGEKKIMLNYAKLRIVPD
jgi:DNA helicase-2/ATP-dependent DNA helicase PcrA